MRKRSERHLVRSINTLHINATNNLDLCFDYVRLITTLYGAFECRSASSPNSPIVRITSSTFSRKPFTVNRANRIVSVLKVLEIKVSGATAPLTTQAYAMRVSSSTIKMRSTACGWSSASTSMACFAIAACLADANGIRTVLCCDCKIVRSFTRET